MEKRESKARVLNAGSGNNQPVRLELAAPFAAGL
jgi:hypothetical protein